MVEWAAETRGVRDRSSLSLAGDACWPAAAPGGRSPVRERERGRDALERERERAGVGGSGSPPRLRSPPRFAILSPFLLLFLVKLATFN